MLDLFGDHRFLTATDPAGSAATSSVSRYENWWVQFLWHSFVMICQNVSTHPDSTKSCKHTPGLGCDHANLVIFQCQMNTLPPRASWPGGLYFFAAAFQAKNPCDWVRFHEHYEVSLFFSGFACRIGIHSNQRPSYFLLLLLSVSLCH